MRPARYRQCMHDTTQCNEISSVTGWPKQVSSHFVHIFTNIDRFFKKKFHRHILCKYLLNILPHLNCVATLPCEILIFKNHYKYVCKNFSLFWNDFLLLFLFCRKFAIKRLFHTSPQRILLLFLPYWLDIQKIHVCRNAWRQLLYV